MYLTFLLLLLAGFVIGLLSGLLGIGGGTLIVPVLRLACGLDAVTAVGTSLFTIIPTSLSGFVSHLRNGTANIRLGLLFGVSGALFAVLGSIISNHAPSVVVMGTAAVIIIYSAVTMLRKAFGGRSAKPAGQDAATTAPDVGSAAEAVAPQDREEALLAEGESSSPARARRTGRAAILPGIAIGACAGFFSGFVGVGGGFIMVPMALWLFDLSMAEAAGTSLVAVVILAIPGAITHGLAGNVALVQGLGLAAGTIPGALLGGALVKRIPDRALRGFFGIVLIVVGIILVTNEIMLR